MAAMPYASLFLESSEKLKKFTRERMKEGLYTRTVILEVLNNLRFAKESRYFTPVHVASKIKKYRGEIKVVRQKAWGRRYPMEMLGWDDLLKICEHAREEGDIRDFSEEELKQLLDEIYRSS